VPPENPVTTIEQVARDLGRLAEQLEPYADPDARRALLHWRGELLRAAGELQRAGQGSEAPRG
jgi:hypothetical protein